MYENETLLVTSNFSFSHIVFYPFEELSATFKGTKLLSANTLSLEQSKICCSKMG